MSRPVSNRQQSAELGTVPASSQSSQSSQSPQSWKTSLLRLCIAGALGGSVTPAMLALGGLIGLALAPQPWMATVPVSCHLIGTASTAMPAALLMQRTGRRIGLLCGCSIGLLGLGTVLLGVWQGSFWLVCLGALGTGSNAAFLLQMRFAAIETVGVELRPLAISWVMSAGVITAVLGPQAAIWGDTVLRLLDAQALLVVPYAGSLLMLVVLVVLAMLVLSGLRLPRPAPGHNLHGRSYRQLFGQPMFVVALASAVVAHSLMSLVMTASPLAMHHAGHSDHASFLGIQWHVIAMFLPSFATGRLIQRYGVIAIIRCGLALLLGCALVAMVSPSLGNFWGALVLLGLGWNLAFIGSTTLLAQQHRPQESGKVQGLNDLCVFGSAVVAALLSGALISLLGWELLNLLIFPLVIALFGVIGYAKRIQQQSQSLGKPE